MLSEKSKVIEFLPVSSPITLHIQIMYDSKKTGWIKTKMVIVITSRWWDYFTL